DIGVTGDGERRGPRVVVRVGLVRLLAPVAIRIVLHENNTGADLGPLEAAFAEIRPLTAGEDVEEEVIPVHFEAVRDNGREDAKTGEHPGRVLDVLAVG